MPDRYLSFSQVRVSFGANPPRYHLLLPRSRVSSAHETTTAYRWNRRAFVIF